MIMSRKKKGKGKLVAGALVVVVIAAFIVYALFTSVLPSMVSSEDSSLETFGVQSTYGTGLSSSIVNNCNTVRYKEDVWTGQNAQGTSGYPNKEILDKVRYRTTKSSSDSILFKGNIYTSASTHKSVSQRAYYNVYIREIPKNMNWKKIIGLNYMDKAYVNYLDSSNWRSCKSYPSSGSQTVRTSTGSFSLKGLHNGAIKIEFVVEFKSSTTGRTFQKTMSTDYAYVTL